MTPPYQYKFEMMRLVLERIANCDDASTVEGIRELARITLDEVDTHFASVKG